jgi:hypothetical protein
MKELLLSTVMIERLEGIYAEMEAAYDEVAWQLGFSCQGCSDNCCDSYFLHHTYVEWCYLQLGIQQLSGEKQVELRQRSVQYIDTCMQALRLGRQPQILCPLNENGLCILYKHRLMICRTHGVPAFFVRPDGERVSFPGCFRCQERVGGRQNYPTVDRTLTLQRLAVLENQLLQSKRHLFPRVKLTIAEMLARGYPQVPDSFR